MYLLNKFRAFPGGVRTAWLWLGAGWGLHFLFLWLAFILGRQDLPEKILYQQVAIAALLFFFLYQGRKWARVLCLLCNALIILLYAAFAALFGGRSPELALLAVFVIGCFGAASGYFMTPAVRAFYAGAGANPVPESNEER